MTITTTVTITTTRKTVTEKEKAAYLYNYWKEVNEKTWQRYGRNNAIALSGMKRHAWAID